jgi:membrane fusion protein (multidrug efflux system)
MKSQSNKQNVDREPDATSVQNGKGLNEGRRLDQDAPNGHAKLEVENPGNEAEAGPEEPKSPAPNRRKWLLAVGAIALVVGSVEGWHWWQFQQTHVTTDNAQIQGHPSPISAKITATVQKVLVKDGDYVKAGQPIVILKDEDLTLKVQQAEAQLAVAKAQLQSATDTVPLTGQTNTAQVQQSQAKLSSSQSSVSAAQAEVAQAQAAIETNQAKVNQAQTAVNKAQADFRRYEALFQQGAIAAQQFDSARAAYEDAQANLAAANRTVAQSRAALKNAQAGFQKSLADATAAKGQLTETKVSGQTVVIQQDQQQLAQAQVKQAAAALALARQQLAYTLITAPVSGYVGELTAQVGQKIQAEQPFLSLVPLQNDQVYVEANFKETTTGHLRIGQKADIKVDAYPGEIFHAAIAGISPATGSRFALIPPDNATGNYNKVVQWVPIRLTFDPNTDLQHKLRPGLSVTVVVDTRG